MARRSAPPNSGPAYIAPSQSQRRTLADPHESAFSRFLREEILAPEKRPGNLSLLTGIGMFVGGIMAVRTWGEMMVPA
ncbi:ATP-dependent RNA helicase MRH4, mitochondrial [Mycena venus]|uniref:ATP-dependent RNA helicase MRH4, mitochondrial n=1 Tax=Mycena venus TaxID=2733690 RepID=A0A8H6Z1Q0_9AGAR|nr:ATP-dependent RNA helicase MRH4, mitochondrial [Mycena venus]